jgi:hypothetical protein
MNPPPEPPRKEPSGSFSLEDLRALRYLAIAIGAVASGLFIKAGPGGTLVVVGFVIAIVLGVASTLYGLHILRKKKEAEQARVPQNHDVNP